jgi:hypothetical protein
MVINFQDLSDHRHWWNVDSLGFVRGKYWSPLFAVRIGLNAIRNTFCSQLALMQQEGIKCIGENHLSKTLTIGETPCLISEFGIPFDMNGKKAYIDGDFGIQLKAMNANYEALERNLLSSTIWTYCPDVSSSLIFPNFRTPIYWATDLMERISVSGVAELPETPIFRE